MAELKESMEEKKRRSQPAREFSRAVSDLKECIQVDQMDTEVESAMEVMRKAFNDLYKVHNAYLDARQGSEEENEIPEDPDDTRWMNRYKQTRVDAVEMYKEWKKRKTVEELTRKMEDKLKGIGDPDKEIGVLLERNATVGCIREVIQDMKDKLAKIQEAKQIPVAADGINAEAWERRFEAEVGAKYQAAIL